ncbi:MAG: hypothetical protein ACO1N9_11010 [Flavobacterium sp.]
MKKIIILVLMFAGISASAQEPQWDEWQKTSCYSNISYRLLELGKHGEQYHWKVQFRNDYPNIISFNYHVTNKVEKNTPTTHRKTLNTGQVSEEIDLYTATQDVYLLADKVSMTPYPENFVQCDTD